MYMVMGLLVRNQSSSTLPVNIYLFCHISLLVIIKAYWAWLNDPVEFQTISVPTTSIVGISRRYDGPIIISQQEARTKAIPRFWKITRRVEYTFDSLKLPWKCILLSDITLQLLLLPLLLLSTSALLPVEQLLQYQQPQLQFSLCRHYFYNYYSLPNVQLSLLVWHLTLLCVLLPYINADYLSPSIVWN